MKATSKLRFAPTLSLVVYSLLWLMSAESMALQFEVVPYLQHVTQTSITIMWLTDQPASSTVEFEQNVSLSRNVSLADKRNVHEVELTGLEPETV